MAKTSFPQWDTTANNNTDVGGINIAEGCPPSNINNAIREVMAQLRSGVDPGFNLVAKSANYTAIASDEGAWLRFTTSATLSLTAAATLLTNWYVFVQADGGSVIIDPNASETINGLTTITLKDGEAAYVICDGTNFRAYRFSAPASYVVKTANYTALDADYNASIRFTSAATMAIDVTANLRTNWRVEVWNDSAGVVIIDPDSTNTVNGAVSIALQPAQRIVLFKTGATTFQANIFGDPQSGPQLQGYITGLVATRNAGTPNNNVDFSAGSAASSASPYYLLTLAASITKNMSTNWAVGSGNGALDTGSVGDTTYYVYLIQRSDTGVVDVLSSLSSTAPTMPTNYDRRTPALYTFSRSSGVNGALSSFISRPDYLQSIEISAAVSTIDIPNLNYGQVEISGSIAMASTTSLLGQVSTDNGATWITTSTYIYQAVAGNSGAAGASTSAGQGAMQLTGAASVSTSATAPMSISLTLFNFNKSIEFRSINTFEATNSPIVALVSNRNPGTTSRNAFRLIAGTGNITFASLKVKGKF